MMEAVATAGLATKVPATIKPKIATTKIKQAKQKHKKSCLPQKPRSFSIIYPIERPPFLTERKSEAKSCIAPTKIQPIKIQIKAGSHPKYAAIIGPTIGPAPAIEESGDQRARYDYMAHNPPHQT